MGKVARDLRLDLTVTLALVQMQAHPHRPMISESVFSCGFYCRELQKDRLNGKELRGVISVLA